MARLTKIEAGFGRLALDDECWHIGEFQSHGGYSAGETNQWISNLKIEPPVPAHRQKYKNQAIAYWAEKLRDALNSDNIRNSVTFVPVPCSKPAGHPQYDDRMMAVLQRLSLLVGPLDVRRVVVTHTERVAQHKAVSRSSPEDLLATMQVDPAAIVTPLRETVLVVDDVFTQGSTFCAMKSLLRGIPNAQRIGGVFLARTVWPAPDFSAFFPQLPE